MPCDSVVTNVIDLKVTNRDLLAKAITAEFKSLVQAVGNEVRFRAEGYAVTIRNGQAESQHPALGRVVDRLKDACCVQAVQAATKRYSWTLKQTAPNKYQVIRRA